MSIGFLLCHWGMRVASSERIKQLTWKGKELAERQSRLVTQAWVTFCGCYNIKIDWFGLQVLSLVSVILDYEPRLTMFFLCWQNWAHLPVFMSLSVLIQLIDSNQNNLNLKEPACEFHTPIIIFFTFPHCPPPPSSYWSPIANEDGGISHVHSTIASCKNLPSNSDRQHIHK